MKSFFLSPAFWRGALSIIVFLILWEIGARSKQWMAPEFFTPLKELLGAMGFKKEYLPWIGAVPAPSTVLTAWMAVLAQPGYWQSWYMSFFRVISGFIAAMIIGIPFGLALAVSRVAHGIGFPTFEVLRPIPPLAWVPASIIFWPTQELAITFITFLGAFYTIVINVLGGARSIDVRYFQAAQSMGSSRWDIFRRVILPGTLPSIVVGSAVLVHHGDEPARGGGADQHPCAEQRHPPLGHQARQRRPARPGKEGCRLRHGDQRG